MNRTTMGPFVKWAGGKRQMLEQPEIQELKERLIAGLQGEEAVYYED